MSTSDDLAVAAGYSVEPSQWQVMLDERLGRVAGRFGRVEPRRRVRAFVLGLLADLPRKNCWSIAAYAGDATPDGMQHLLARACGARKLDAACTVPKFDAWLLTRCFLVGLGGSPVFVDHASEDSTAPDRGVERSHRGGVVEWRVLAEALMRAVVIEVPGKPIENGEGMFLVVDQHPVEALLADTADESFRIAVRAGGPRRDLDHVETFRGEDGVKGRRELGVPVADEKAK